MRDKINYPVCVFTVCIILSLVCIHGCGSKSTVEAEDSSDSSSSVSLIVGTVN